jgi:preprotein translocase subunit SecB
MKTIKQFHFHNFKIQKIFFQANPVWEKKEDKVPIDTNLQIDSNIDEMHLSVRFTISHENEDSPFTFLVEAIGNFSFDEEVSSDEAVNIGNVNGAAIMFPYLRETIADITRRAGFPPLHHSPVNFEAVYEAKKKELETKKQEESATD